MGRVVKSASGMSVRVSDMLYDENGKGFVVVDVSETDDPFLSPIVTVRTSDGLERLVTDPGDMFHSKPVKCADGRVLRSGQIVWPLYGDDGPFVVNMVIGRFVSCYKLYDPDSDIHISPDGLSHYKPEPPDTWERIEEDAANLDEMPCPFTAKDLVRRCKKLAERGE